MLVIIIAIVGKGHFTNGGHYMILRGKTAKGKMLTADSINKKKSTRVDLGLLRTKVRKKCRWPF